MPEQPAPGAPICWQCGDDVPAAAQPSPFCTYACRDLYWGVGDSPRCRTCATPAGACATMPTISRATRCCSWCDHRVLLTDDAVTAPIRTTT